MRNSTGRQIHYVCRFTHYIPPKHNLCQHNSSCLGKGLDFRTVLFLSIDFIIQAYVMSLSFALWLFTDIAFLQFKIEGLWPPWVQQVCRRRFSNNICSLCVSVLVIFTIFHTFSLLLCLWWSVISDLCCYSCICYGASQAVSTWDGKLHPYVFCVLIAPMTGLFPCLSPSSWASLLSETQRYWN